MFAVIVSIILGVSSLHPLFPQTAGPKLNYQNEPTTNKIFGVIAKATSNPEKRQESDNLIKESEIDKENFEKEASLRTHCLKEDHCSPETKPTMQPSNTPTPLFSPTPQPTIEPIIKPEPSAIPLPCSPRFKTGGRYIPCPISF